MNDAALEILLYRIISGKFYFFYKNDTYELRQPSIDIKYESEILYNKIIYEEKYNEWLREDNLDRILTTLGLWTMDTKTILKSLDKSIDDTKVRLYEQRASTKAVQDNKKKLKTIRNQINRLLNSKSDIFSHTLEGYASSIKNEHVICNTLYKDNKLVFDKGIKNNEHSYTLFNNLVKEINEHVLDSPQFKLLARTDMWRMYWNANKGNVFPGSASEWSFDQRTLVNVSRMYDNVHEHPECPEEEVIKDDDMIISDSWDIAVYLEKSYESPTSLFGASNDFIQVKFISSWVDSQLHPLIARCVVRDILNVISPSEHEYFRTSREKRFGKSEKEISQTWR